MSAGGRALARGGAQRLGARRPSRRVAKGVVALIGPENRAEQTLQQNPQTSVLGNETPATGFVGAQDPLKPRAARLCAVCARSTACYQEELLTRMSTHSTRWHR